MAIVASSHLHRRNQRGRHTAFADRFIVPVGYWIRTGLVCMHDGRDYDMATVRRLVGAPVDFDLRLLRRGTHREQRRATAVADVSFGSPKLHFAALADEFDVTATRERGAEHAADRYSLWLDVVRGTPRAHAWAPQAHRIGADGRTLHAARRAFLRQPRVEAMVHHNRTHPSVHLDPDELDAFQAGKRNYVTYHRLAATVGDALITGMNQEPMRARSPLLSQRLGFLTAANAHLDTLATTAMLAFRRAEPLVWEAGPVLPPTPAVWTARQLASARY
ncbi:hypothetical protein Drose_16935 [Dactylosporangium roseum]|uniref:Uncharacterized protein n=1 Tax=Dactylosporangium roseum TaxID=47989 RepID=A0ABY5ZD01_9ACTN|nr:hypothetical protein [Dactylosporangium roseum]UWZ39752.1 hypothetical protein Drose_16935 [Dactylosporangium roseum]